MAEANSHPSNSSIVLPVTAQNIVSSGEVSLIDQNIKKASVEDGIKL